MEEEEVELRATADLEETTEEEVELRATWRRPLRRRWS